MGSTSLNRAHKAAREALDEIGLPWTLTGQRMAYVAKIHLNGVGLLSGEGKSQLAAMRDLRAKYDAEMSKAA